MNTTRTLFLLSLGLLLLTGLNFYHSFLPLPAFVSGFIFGTAIAGTFIKGWQLLRQPA